jgi:hypothetical protein
MKVHPQVAPHPPQEQLRVGVRIICCEGLHSNHHCRANGRSSCWRLAFPPERLEVDHSWLRLLL